MRIKRHCKNCGAIIDVSKERHYVVKLRSSDGGWMRDGLCADAYDCQECGCQYIAGIREINTIKKEDQEVK